MKYLYILIAVIVLGAGAYLLLQPKSGGVAPAAQTYQSGQSAQNSQNAQDINAQLDAATPADSSSNLQGADANINTL